MIIIGIGNLAIKWNGCQMKLWLCLWFYFNFPLICEGHKWLVINLHYHHFNKWEWLLIEAVIKWGLPVQYNLRKYLHVLLIQIIWNFIMRKSHNLLPRLNQSLPFPIVSKRWNSAIPANSLPITPICFADIGHLLSKQIPTLFGMEFVYKI